MQKVLRRRARVGLASTARAFRGSWAGHTSFEDLWRSEKTPLSRFCSLLWSKKNQSCRLKLRPLRQRRQVFLRPKLFWTMNWNGNSESSNLFTKATSAWLMSHLHVEVTSSLALSIQTVFSTSKQYWSSIRLSIFAGRKQSFAFLTPECLSYLFLTYSPLPLRKRRLLCSV